MNPMTTAFTPGPWPEDGIMYGKGIIFNVPGVAANGVFEWRANQKLIRAAPDLFAVLAGADREFSVSSGLPPWEFWESWIEAARATLAKATSPVRNYE